MLVITNSKKVKQLTDCYPPPNPALPTLTLAIWDGLWPYLPGQFSSWLLLVLDEPKGS